MNVKLKALGAGVVFFIGGHAVAQQRSVKNDTVKEQQIQEVVVLGYNKTTTKAKSNAATTTISSEVLENRPNVTFLNSIQGNAPGISINSASGSPGSGKINVLIRGLGSLGSSRDPLYVIDGLASSGSQFRNLNPNDIESLSILRDAASTSIYGNRAANGVVVITTKSGRYNSALQVSYDALTSFSTYPQNKYELADAKQMLQVQKNYGAGMGASMTQSAIDNYAINTDWNKIFFQTGLSQQHTLGLRVGGQNASLFSSLGYTKSEGIFRSTDFQRFSFRNNLVGKTNNGKLNYSAQLGLGYSKRNQLDQEENSGISNNSIQNVLFGVVTSAPYLDKYNFINGADMFDQGYGTTYRPWILYDNMIGGVRNRYNELSVIGNINATYKLTDYLSVGNRSGIDFKESDRVFARSPLGYLSTAVAAGQGTPRPYGGSETFSTTRDFTFNSVTNLTYNQTFGDHTLTVGTYLDYVKAHYLFNSLSQNGLNPLTWEFGAGTGYVPFNPATPNIYRPTISAGKVDAGTLAYFATADYDFASKYGISGVIRRDASYRFSKDNRWGTFYAVSGRWNIDRENFMDGSKFRMLKLRASYGTQGNQNLGIAANNFNPLFLLPTLYLDSNTSGTGYQNLPAYFLNNLSNANLQWETQKMGNVGLDINYNGFVEFNVDLYRKLTTNLFNNINLSAVTGQWSVRGNNGEMENKGIEANLRLNPVRKENGKVSFYVNGAYNKNTVLAMENQDLTGDNVNAVGGPAYQWQLYRYVGVNPQTGEQQYLDANGNITEAPTAKDRVLTGKSYFPKYSGGFGMSTDYKGFFADVNFSYQAGGYMYDNLYSWLMNPAYAANGMNVSSALLNAWTPSNTGSSIPKITATNSGTEGSSDRFLYKTDFIRLRNVALGYSIPRSVLAGLPFRGLKIFAQAENLYTWTKWKGFDPEPIAAYSLSVYPNPKTFSLGFNVEF